MMNTNLVVDNMNLVYSVAHKNFKSYMGNETIREELIATGNMALCIASNTYDPNKGRFSTYAYLAIRNEMVRFLNNFENQSNKGRVLSTEVSFDSPVKMSNDNEGHSYSEIIADTNVEDNSADELLELADKSGIKEMREILEYEIEGWTGTEIAHMKGEKPKTYLERRKRKLKEFRNYLEKIGYRNR